MLEKGNDSQRTGESGLNKEVYFSAFPVNQAMTGKMWRNGKKSLSAKSNLSLETTSEI